MHITLDVLSRFTDLPADPCHTRILLDEVGLEVKRIDVSAPGVPITLELLANRGDHHGYVGLAREISGRTGGEVREPVVRQLEVGESPHPLDLMSERCPVYTLTLLERGSEGGLDAEAIQLLESTGLKSVGVVVDATNVANLELGQPTHAFDADTIEGPITIRESRAGEKAWPLFREEAVELTEGTLVIADSAKILAIAGVIGCEESKTTEATTRVLLESAAFDPVAVRIASRGLGIGTDSSARFERGSDFSLPLRGAGRVAHLLEGAGWRVVGHTGKVGSWSDPRRVIRFYPDRCRAFLAITETDGELVARLERYGFTVGPTSDLDVLTGEQRDPEALSVLVPSHRLWDVEYAADLYEEIVKSIGYDKTPIGLPPIDLGAVPSPVQALRDRAADVLVGHGFFEVITDGFHSKGLRERLGIEEGHPLFAHVEIANALDRAYSLLKNSGLGQALEGVAMNVFARQAEVKAFEFTRAFHPDETAENGVCTEREMVWAVVNGHERPTSWHGTARAADPLFLKGVVGELANTLGLPLELDHADTSHPLSGLLHPGRQVAVRLHGETIGILGEVHPAVVANFKLKRARPVYLELDVQPLLTPAASVPYVEPPRTHPVVRNLAFTLPPRVRAGDVAEHLAANGPDWLDDVGIVDLFEHEHEGVALRTFTYAMVYSLVQGDRTTDEINGATDALIASVEAAFGDRGVQLR